MSKENVNHPSHYNQHPAGIECIEIIRHYTCDIANAIKYLWRAGLKQDADKTAVAKEIEDLNKALWYINDYLDNSGNYRVPLHHQDICHANVLYITDYTVHDIISAFLPDVAEAMEMLLSVGYIYFGEERKDIQWRDNIATASDRIKQRINYLTELKKKKDEEDNV